MDSLKTILIEDSRIADITDQETFGVQSGAAQSTFQSFAATSASNSSIVFSIQIPSENIVIDRHLLLQSQMAFTVNLANVPVGNQCFQYGLTDSLNSFPLNSVFTTVQCTINNTSVSTNESDILAMILRMNDNRVLSRYNSMTPSLPDNCYGNYKDGILTNNNPLASYNNNGYDTDFVSRGCFKLDFQQIDHYVNGVYLDSSPMSTNTSDTWKVSIKVTITEPMLCLSPWLNCRPNNEAGLVGINNMSFVLNIDQSLKKLFSTANVSVNGSGDGLTSYIQSINLGISPHGGVQNNNGFNNTKLLFNFLSLQPEQYAKLSTKNVVSYLEYPRFLSNFNNTTAIAPGQTAQLTSQSIQLNQIPALIMISCRVPLSSQNWAYTNSFLAIKNISINFNNASGLLASATTNDLYNISFANGSAQSWAEFNGQAAVNDNTTGLTRTIPTTGSMLVLNPVYNFGLSSMLSNSSLGQYQFQFNLNVYNQFPFTITPEICIVTMNEGIFVSNSGTSAIHTGILTKERVLETKAQNPVPHLSSNEYESLVGGKLQNRGMSNVLKMIKKMSKGGNLSGGGGSGGNHKSKLSKFL